MPALAWSALLALALVSGCRRTAPDRKDVLRGLVADVVLPSYRELSAAAARLDGALRALDVRQTPETLRQARAALRVAMRAVKRTATFRVGPIADRSLHFRAAYFPVRPAGIEALAAGERSIDARLLEEAGVAVKGLFAIEYLLHEPPAGDEALERLRGSERHRRYLRALGEDIARQAAALLEAAGAGDLPGAFAAGGQASLDRLVNDAAEVVETVVAGKIVLATTLASQDALGRGLVEGERSGASHETAIALLEGVRAVYGSGRGHDLSTLARAAAPAVDARVQAALADATAALAALPGPLEVAVTRDPAAVERARAACHTLERAFKADLANALGVTLTFRSVDGD